MNLSALTRRTQDVLRQPRTRKAGWWIGGTIAAFGLFGFFAGPPIAKSILVDKLGEALHRKVSIDKIAINPYMLTARIDGFSARAESHEMLGFDVLYVNLSAASLFRGGPVITDFVLNGPRVQVTRLADGRYDVSDLIEQWSKPSEGPKSEARFAVNNIQVNDGKLTFIDQPTGATHAVTDLKLRLPFISNLPDKTEINVLPHFSARVNGAPLVLDGRSKPFDASRESELSLDLDQVDLLKYLPYSPVKLPVTVKQATLDTRLKLLFRQADDAPAALRVTGNAQLKDLAIAETDGAPLLRWKLLDVALDDFDLMQNKLALGDIRLSGLEQHVRVSKQGKLNWQEIAARLQGAPAPAGKKAEAGKPLDIAVKAVILDDAAWHWSEAARTQQLRLKHGEIKAIAVAPAQRKIRLAEIALDGADLRLLRDAQGFVSLPASGGGDTAGDAPWTFALDRLALTGSAVRYEETGLKEKSVQQIDNLQFNLDGFTTAPGSKAKLALKARINQKGGVDVGGDVQLQPLAANLDLDLNGLPILPAQPFFSEKLNITLLRGQLSSKGKLTLSQGKDGMGGGFKGQLGVSDLHTIDKLNSADFLKWKTLAVNNIDTRFEPFSLNVGEVALSDFYARIIVTPEGKINLSQILRQPEEAKPAQPVVTPPPEKDAEAPAGSGAAKTIKPTPAKPVAPIRIDRIAFKNGTVRFSDYFVKPNYTANVTRIGGRISGLSSAAGTLADLELHGGYGNAAPVSVTAKLNPLAAKSYLDLKGEVRGVDLTTLSTYSAKYAGYAIDKGKLSLYVTYKLENNQLNAENRVFLDQLTFGEKVDSPDATSLPVKLAVALLTNGRGEIDINLPISGSLEDPQFSVGGVIVRVIVNLFVKAVTSPFALLGSLFGGGEELSNIEFAPGQRSLSPAAVKKLEALAKAMNDRPALKLEITGRVDPAADLEGSKRAAIDRAVRAEKLKALTSKGVETGSVDTITVDAKEYPEYLKRVYSAAKFTKPRNLIGMQKDIAVEEMEKLLLANTTVGEEDLRRLAVRRSEIVQSWLVEQGKVPVERLFLMAPKIKEDAKPEAKLNPSRVDFSLR